MKKLGLLIFVLLVYCVASASQINHNSKESFNLFNKQTGKIIKYQLLNPGENIVYTITKADTLQIFTRVVVEDLDREFYEYNISASKYDKVLQKSIKYSSVTRGLGGEKVSAYNYITLPPESYEKKIQIKNISKMKMLVKVRSNKIRNSVNDVEFIRYSPSVYDDEVNVQIDDRTFTYHSANSKPIELTLEGPILLKIVSRVIFNDTVNKKKKYRYSVYDNDVLISEFNEESYKSKKAILNDDTSKTPSSGNTNIVRLDSGIHKLRIEDNDKSRKLMFRLYISRSSVGIVSYE
jgi:hypothetical protein